MVKPRSTTATATHRELRRARPARGWKPAGGAIALHALFLTAAMAVTWSARHGADSDGPAETRTDPPVMQSRLRPGRAEPLTRIHPAPPTRLRGARPDALHLPDIDRDPAPVPSPPEMPRLLMAASPQLPFAERSPARPSPAPRRGPGTAAGRKSADGNPSGSGATSRKPVPPRITAPRLLRSPAPAFPASARRAGHEGTVWVRVTVSPQGRATSVALHRSAGDDALDQAALAAVKKWTFSPGTSAGNPVNADAIVKVRFALR